MMIRLRREKTRREERDSWTRKRLKDRSERDGKANKKRNTCQRKEQGEHTQRESRESIKRAKREKGGVSDNERGIRNGFLEGGGGGERRDERNETYEAEKRLAAFIPWREKLAAVGHAAAPLLVFPLARSLSSLLFSATDFLSLALLPSAAKTRREMGRRTR